MNSKLKYKSTQVGDIPNDWEIKKLSDLAVGKGSYGIGASAVDFDENLPRYLRITDISEQGRLLNEDLKSVDDADSYKYILKENDIVFARTGNTTGKTYLYNVKDGLLIYAGFLIKFSINSKIADPRFIKYFTETNFYWYWVNIMSVRSGQPGINENEYAKLPVPFPKLVEQQKIASILSTWDKAIELKEKLIKQKNEQKKGLMQKLLTGEVRLPGFEGEWREVKLGKIGKTYNGLSGKTAEDFGEGKPYIPYKTIFDDSKINLQKIDYVKINIGEKQNSAKKGDIFFTTSSETPHEVGMSSVLLEDVDEIYLNSFCFGYRLNDFSELLPNFAQHYFRSDDFRKKIYALAQGSTRFNISKNEVMKIAIKIPDLKEQEGISKILSESDKEILLLVNQVRRLKEQKQGLMQLLLTGKVRVKV